jgi:hypothetical protein
MSLSEPGQTGFSTNTESFWILRQALSGIVWQTQAWQYITIKVM